MEPEKQTNHEHNLRVLQELKQGDLIKFDRGLYSHWAVYCGDNKVVHLHGEPGGDDQNVFTVDGKQYKKVRALVDDFWAVAKGSKAEKDNYLDKEYQPYAPNDVVEIATNFTEIEALPYSLLWFNCEHFATICRYGTAHSKQADHLVKMQLVAASGAKAVKAVIKKIKERI